MLESLIISLVLTLIIEVWFALIFKVRGKIDIAVVFLANIITNPVIVTIENLIWTIENYTLMITLSFIIWMVLEVVVILVEGYIYNKLRVKSKYSPYKLSLILNSISILFGIVYTPPYFSHNSQSIPLNCATCLYIAYRLL